MKCMKMKKHFFRAGVCAVVGGGGGVLAKTSNLLKKRQT